MVATEAAPVTDAAPATQAPKPFKVTLKNAPKQVVARMGDAVLPLARGRITVPAAGGEITLQAPGYVERPVVVKPGETEIDAHLRRVPRTPRVNSKRKPDEDSLEPWGGP